MATGAILGLATKIVARELFPISQESCFGLTNCLIAKFLLLRLIPYALIIPIILFEG